MLRGDWQAGACVFAALYMPDDAWRAAPARRWPRVADALAVAEPASLSGAAGLLSRAGMWEESALLAEQGRLAWGESLVAAGRALTPFDPRYPSGWLDALGSGAPPALWVSGSLPSRPLVGVVGSRALPLPAQRLARGIGAFLAGSGRGVVSGGAWGADRLGVAGAVSAGSGCSVEILPCGLGCAGPSMASARLSLWPADAAFSGQRAMVRNRLIYAWSRQAVVVHARYGAGGTWGGAVDSLRRGLGRVVVADWGDAASAALCALGGVRLACGPGWQAGLEFALRQPLAPAQPDLFGFGVVREPVCRYRTA